MIRSLKFVVSPVLNTGQVYTSDVEIPEVVLGVLILQTQRKFQRKTALGPKQQEAYLQSVIPVLISPSSDKVF